MLADGGGKVNAITKPLQGSGGIAKALLGWARMEAHLGWRIAPAIVNGLPGCLILDDHQGGALVQTIALAPSEHATADGSSRIGALYIQRNPDKLAALAQRLGIPLATH